MELHEIRREFIKLRVKQKFYSECKKILNIKFNQDISIRTLKRWQKRFNEEENWDFQNKSKRPNHIY